MRRHFLAIVILLIQPASLFADTIAFDSLSTTLRQPLNTREQVDRLNEMVLSLWVSGRATDDLVAEQRRVLTLARQSGYKKGEADALSNLVRLFLNRYESTLSLEYALEALRLNEELGNEPHACYNLMQLGIIYYTSQNYEKSNDYYRQALLRYQAIGDSGKVATLHYLTGLNHARLEQFPEGLAELRAALEWKERLHDRKGAAECLTGISELFVRMSKPDSALANVDEAAARLDTAENTYGLTKMNLVRSAAYRLKNMPDLSLQYARSALSEAQRLGARELRLEAFDAVSKALERTGDYRGAMEMARTHQALRDSLFNEKNTSRISQLESAFVLEKNERQIALLEKEKKISELLLLGTAAIAVLVLTLALVLYNRFQIKHKANKNLEEAYRKLTETQEQLIHHKKMSSLGRLTTGLSHELQNPLNFVNNFSEVVDDLLQELDTASMNPDQQAIVDELKSSSAKIGLHGKRAQRIVHQMQEHSDMVPGEAESVDMNAIVLQCLDRAYQEQKAENDSFDCKVVRELDLSMPQARVQVSQFIRVWHNIFRNAFQSVKQKAQETPRYVPEVRVVSSHRGNHIRIACRDNGVGMDPKTLERAYEPFFTTKPTGTATGLGLSLSYDIVTAHHGEITAMSEKGVFAEFVVNLPVEADGL